MPVKKARRFAKPFDLKDTMPSVAIFYHVQEVILNGIFKGMQGKPSNADGIL